MTFFLSISHVSRSKDAAFEEPALHAMLRCTVGMRWQSGRPVMQLRTAYQCSLSGGCTERSCIICPIMPQVWPRV